MKKPNSIEFQQNKIFSNLNFTHQPKLKFKKNGILITSCLKIHLFKKNKQSMMYIL